MANSQLVEFIKESRKKGFNDWQIREPLLKGGWPMKEVEDAFHSLREDTASKTQITVFLDKDIYASIEKRAKKNMFNLHEQIEDILRRSCISLKQKPMQSDDIDDKFIGLFSRRRRESTYPLRTKYHLYI